MRQVVYNILETSLQCEELSLSRAVEEEVAASCGQRELSKELYNKMKHSQGHTVLERLELVVQPVQVALQKLHCVYEPYRTSDSRFHVSHTRVV